MSSVFVIVKSNWVCISQNIEAPSYTLCATGDVLENIPYKAHPAFTSKEKADEYLLTLPKHDRVGVAPFEIEIKE
jgi:hypothetical protein